MLLIPRNIENREQKLFKLHNKKIQQYIKNGCIGNLDLFRSKITKLPDNIKIINGNLDLFESKINELPDNLTVNGFLDLNGSNITKLPDNLTVHAWLDIRDTKIIQLPSNLNVGYFIYKDF